MEGYRLGVMWHFFILIVVTVSLLLVACGDSQARKPKKKNYIEQNGYIHFELGGEKFKVSKGYFRGVGETQWGSLVYVKVLGLAARF
ncbi:MAG: hypothetical protein AB2653_14900 [Candidatus Thiodiazotropha endolucinida]